MLESEGKNLRGRSLTVAAESEGATTISVYDPAMCCSTGVCGPSTDPELTRISQDLRWAESQGAKVERFNLAQEPDAFVGSQKVSGLMQAFGEEALPAVLVDGSVAFHGRYPSKEELVEAVRGSASASDSEPISGSQEGRAESGSCCGPDSGCC